MDTKRLLTANGTRPGHDEFSSDLQTTVGRDSLVGMATRYGLDGPGTDYRWVQNFPHPPSLLYSEYRVSFSGRKRPEHDVNHP